MMLRRRFPVCRARPRGALEIAAAALCGALASVACSRGTDDPILPLLGKLLQPGERAVLVRTLDPGRTRVAAVVDTNAGKPELRLYARNGAADYALVLKVQQGDAFRNLSLEDLDGDGKDEIVSTWDGGHLEIVEVIAQGVDQPYRSIFRNAGRQIEKRYDAAGLAEFWITSRTYEEGPGQPPAYATTVYRFSGGQYVEASRK